MNRDYVYEFAKESNKIEGLGEPSLQVIQAYHDFLSVSSMALPFVQDFVSVVQPGAKLRDQTGLNVQVGNHRPPSGGPQIRENLISLLEKVEEYGDPYALHVHYETLHPFTDGNGRSGRVLWLWSIVNRMGKYPRLGFLHSWYYYSLDQLGGRNAD